MSRPAPARLEEARTAVRYHRERLALYRARGYRGKGTTISRLRELELACQAAEERLARAEAGETSSQ